MAAHSSILAWRIPRIEEPSRLQFMGSHRIKHDWATNILQIFYVDTLALSEFFNVCIVFNRIVYSFFFFWLCHTARGDLSSQIGIEPGPLAVRNQSPNHWKAKEFPADWCTLIYPILFYQRIVSHFLLLHSCLLVLEVGIGSRTPHIYQNS